MHLPRAISAHLLENAQRGIMTLTVAMATILLAMVGARHAAQNTNSTPLRRHAYLPHALSVRSLTDHPA
ncbi:hypothetical protein Q0M94_21630 (plasmid) [Deinococcus radiomollis]|uniref:hypothetical protein n=1 Tax=Deinococcus radiomollis TaxID=468916 RepID=UPI0038914503